MSNHSKQYLDINGLRTYYEGTKIIHGYYNSTNGNFYEESTYETLITPQTNRLYVDLGSDIIYEYKSNSYVAFTGTGNYNNLSNKPSINNITLIGNKSLNDLGVASEDSVEIEEFNNKTPYIYRASAGGDRVYEKLIGGTIAWNQLCPIRSDFSGNGITLTSNSDGSYNVNGTAEAVTVITFGSTFTVYQNHKYYIKGCPSDGGSNKYYFGLAGYVSETGSGAIFNYPSATSKQNARLDVKSGANISNAKIIPQVIDLTQMFGSTIADYIYSLEQATAGAGVAWFRALFPNDYYAYDSGSLQSVNVASKKVVGFNQIDESQIVNGSLNTATGEVQTNANRNVTGFIKINPNWNYYMNYLPTGNVSIYAFMYDKNQNYIGYNGTSLKNSQFTPKDLTNSLAGGGSFKSARYVRFRIDSASYTLGDACLNISNASKNGTYEPYEEHTYAFDSDLTLRGIPKLDANNNLYYDGDVYESDGTVTRRYGIVDLGSLTWIKVSDGKFYAVKRGFEDFDDTNVTAICQKYILGSYAEWNSGTEDKIICGVKYSSVIYIRDTSYTDAQTFKTAMSGVYLVYELATPTTESADPYINPQIVDADGTEEFVDYAQSQGTRDVAVPVEHESKYIIFPEWLRNKYFNDLYDKAAGDHTHDSATTTSAGFMSASDKTKLNGIASGAEVNVIETVKVNNTALTPSNKAVNISVPTKVSELTNDSGYTTNTGTVTSVKVGSTSYNPENGVVSLPAYPTTLPASDVSSWAKASTKPSYSASEISGLTAAATTAIDTTVTQSSSNLITSGAVYTAIDNLPNPMVFKGTLGSGGTITSLPTASSSNEGYTYKVITAGTYASQSAKVGDVFVSNSSSWVLIPAGDEDTDTWRNIKVNGIELLGTGISTGYVNFKNGNGISVSGNSHDVTIGHSNSITAGTAKGDNDKTLEFGGTFTIPSVTYDAQGHITAKGTTTMTMPANPNSNTIPSAYCASGSSVADKTASCTGFSLLNKSYLHVLIRNNNTVKSALTLNINSTGAKAIYINGSASSSTNYELPAGTYLVYYVDNTFYFRTDGKLTANITGTAGYSSKAAASGGTAVSLVTTGEKYVWNNKSDFDGAYASLSGKPILGTAAALDVAVSGDASSTQVVLGNDSRLTSNIVASSTQPSGQPTGGIWLKIE